MAKKRFTNVADLINSISKDKNFKEETVKELHQRIIANFLFALRCENEFSQEQLAKSIGCTQSRISKIENSRDDEISIKDLLDYGRALDLQLEVGYRDKEAKKTDLVKYHAFKIKDYLNDLVTIAFGDQKIAEGVLDFHVESFYNIMKIIMDSVNQLIVLIIENYPDLDESIMKEEIDNIYISEPFTEKFSQFLSQNKLEDSKIKT